MYILIVSRTETIVVNIKTEEKNNIRTIDNMLLLLC